LVSSSNASSPGSLLWETQLRVDSLFPFHFALDVYWDTGVSVCKLFPPLFDL
jgi:hypothetical protein